MFGITFIYRFEDYARNIQDIVEGKVFDEIKDGKIIGKIKSSLRIRDELAGMDVFLNYKNTKEIIQKHGMLDIAGLVATINTPDRIVLSKGIKKSDILNFIKFSSIGYQIVAAIRINGFATVTHFERRTRDHQEIRRTQHYLDSVMNRGSVIYSSGKTADLPLIVEDSQHPPSEPCRTFWRQSSKDGAIIAFRI